jgi:hypothetical protein
MNPSAFFPKVSGTSLAGESLTFPESFGAPRTLTVLAFWDWQQPMVDTWLAYADRLEIQEPGFEYFEMPVIQRSSPEIHQFIDDGMRAGIQNRRAREKTIALFVDKREFLRTLALPTDDEIYAVLVDDKGLILRIWAGSMTPDASYQLEQLVAIDEVAA